MNNQSLSENLEDWPVNLHEHFGVETNATERDLRRAYHRLIKVYRAEEYPNHFRKLTESYETLRAQIAYQESLTQKAEQDDDNDVGWFPSPPPDRNPPESQSPSTETISQSLMIWERAGDERLGTVITQLEKYCQISPREEEATLQLFWLKKIHDGKPPFEFLENYLANVGLTGRAFQLYLNELDRVPEAATRAGCKSLLKQSANDPRLPELTRLVWFLQYHQKKIGLIEKDLDSLRDELIYDHPSVWKELIYQAAEIIALANLPKSNRLFEKLTEEMNQCNSIPSGEWMESRWEMVRAISCDAPVPGTLSQELLSLIRDSMLQEEWELRHRLELIVLPWLTTYSIGLATLDKVKDWASMGVFLFHRLTTRSRADDYMHYVEGFNDHLRPAVIEFVRTVNFKQYLNFRLEVVRFCRQEDISLELFLNALLEAQRDHSPQLLVSDEIVRLLNDDLPLKALIAAIRIFNE
jgi:hypothetical protein